MNTLTIDHLAICVRNVDAASERFAALFGATHHFTKVFDSLQCRSAFFTLGNRVVTFEEPTSPDSAFADFLDKRGEGVHHVGVEVDDLMAAKAHVESLGVKIANLQTEDDERWEFLILPKDAFGVLMQVIEWRGTCKDSLEARLDYSSKDLFMGSSA